jgi:hypothetical protein
MDANGNKIWRRYFGGSHVDQSKDVLQTDDGGFLLIGISESSDFDISDARGANDYWVVKINADGDLIWVSETRQHYVVDVDINGVPSYSPANIGGGGPATPPVAGTGFMWYGGQQNVYDYNVSNLPSAKPSTLGYNNNDLITSSGGVSSGAPGYERYNVWRVEITQFVEGYNFEGSIQGRQGDQGPQGDQGLQGEAFTVDGQGTLLERPDCSTVADG